MSDLLRQYLAEWLEWAEGTFGSMVFEECAGLCSNFRWYMRARGIEIEVANLELKGLEKAFREDGLLGEYPFGGKETYAREYVVRSAHLNPARLAWVRSKVGRAVPEESCANG